MRNAQSGQIGRKGQLGMEFSMTVASAMIVFVSLLVVMGGVKNTLQENSSRVSALAIGQRVVASMDAMFRDSCDVSCSTTATLPSYIYSFGTTYDYNVTFEGSRVVVDYGVEKVAVESGRSLDQISVSKTVLPGGKTMKISYAG